MSTSISVVVPVFNEEENVKALFDEIVEVCTSEGYDFEVVFVDDGSTDRTLSILKTLSPIRVVRLRRNFGQTAGMDAGIRAATKELVVTLDGDRQNDPHDIPKLIEYLRVHELDVVSGWRKRRNDSFMKKFVSRGANFLRSVLVKDGIHDSGCTLKVYKRECFEQVFLFGEMHRFIPALLRIKGFRVGEMTVNHRPRVAGITKYNWRRMIKGFLDMISIWFWNKYAVRPLHLLGGAGLLLILLGFISGVYTVAEYFMNGKVGHTAWPVLTGFSLILGFIMVLFGLMADIMSKTYYSTSRDSSYSVAEVLERK